MVMTKIALLDPNQDISSLGVEQLQSLIQKATAIDPGQGNCQMVEFTLKLKKRLRDLTELNRAAAAALNQQLVAYGESKAEAECVLKQAEQAKAEAAAIQADARAARKLIEQTQAETEVDIEAINAALDAEAKLFRQSLDGLFEQISVGYTPLPMPSSPSPSVEDLKREFAGFADIFAAAGAAGLNQRSAAQPPHSKNQQLQELLQQPPAQLNYQPTYAPAYLRQAVHRPTPEQEMANAITSVILSLTFMLGAGGIVLSSWLSNRQVLSAPVAEVEPVPTTYAPGVQTAVNQVRSLDAPSRQAWLNFCTQTNDGQGYSQTEQQFCQVLKFN